MLFEKTVHVSDSRSSYPDSKDERLMIHEAMNHFYLDVFSAPELLATKNLNAGHSHIESLESKWLEYEMARIATYDLPQKVGDFHDWYLMWVAKQDESTDSFVTFIAEEARREQIALFFLCEAQVDSKFDDLIALAQIGTSGSVKMAIARNYWDEMGNGRPHLVHTTMFDKSAQYMNQVLSGTGFDVTTLVSPETYANANQLMCYSVHRMFNPRLIGALGILEQCAPRRFAAMIDGCMRVGVPDDVVKYQRVHIAIDQKHGDEWLTQVLQPLVSKSIVMMHQVCIGILTRFNVATDYYTYVTEALRSL